MSNSYDKISTSFSLSFTYALFIFVIIFVQFQFNFITISSIDPIYSINPILKKDENKLIIL